MRIKNKKVPAFTLVEIIIVIGIISILTAIIVPNLMKVVKDKRIDYANQNAKIIFMEVQKEINRREAIDNGVQIDYASGRYNGSDYNEIININGTDTDISFETTLPKEIRKGTWYAEIDQTTKTVTYVSWVEDNSMTVTSIKGISTYSAQKSHNTTASSKRTVGLFPTGTYKSTIQMLCNKKILGGNHMKNLLAKLKAKKKGFTLVELIVVIAIIAVLAAILIPNMITFLGDSKTRAAEANAKSIYNAASAACTKAIADGRTLAGGTVSTTSGDYTFCAAAVGPPASAAIKLSDYQKSIKGSADITFTASGEVTSVKYTSPDGIAATYPKP